MNARAMEPAAIHEFIFGDPLLHTRFSMAIEILARIVIATPRKVTTTVLAESLGQSPRTVRNLLVSLHQSGLLSQDDKERDEWYCASSLGAITLADVFRCVSAATQEPGRKKKTEAAPDGSRSPATQSIDLLLMQATMGINQVVLQHLQAFDLGRLKALGSSSAFPHFHSSVRSYIPEPA